MLYPVELWVHGEPDGPSETGIIGGPRRRVNSRGCGRMGFRNCSGYDGFRTRPDNPRGASCRPRFSNRPAPVEQITEHNDGPSLSETRRSPVTVRKFFPLAVAFGLWAAGPALAQRQGMSPMSAEEKAKNQKLADAVAAKLKSSGAVPKGAKFEIKSNGGVVDLSGKVATAEQHDEILKALSKVPGIKRIESGIMVGDQPMVQRAGGQIGGAGPAAVEPAAATDAVLRHQLDRGRAPMSPMPPVPPMAGGFGVNVYADDEPVPLNGMPAMAPGRSGRPAAAAVRLADLRPVQQLLARGVPAGVPVQRVPVHRAVLPVPEGPARLAEGQAGVGGRALVLRQARPAPHDYWRVRFW